MSLRVFHAAGAWSAGDRLSLDAEESRYLLRVRRAAAGASLEVLDGERTAWRARLDRVEDRRAVVELIEPRVDPEPSPRVLLLVMPEPRATLESITQAAELGATAVYLVRGEHSPGGVPSTERIAKTLRAAQRQCGRASPPRILGPASLDEALQATASLPGFLASPSPATHDAIVLDPTIGARVLVGPEGGLSASEQARASACGLAPLWLGPWVLRTPTAVTASLARLWSTAAPGEAAGRP